MVLQAQALQTLAQIHAFLEGNQALGFEAPQREAAYHFVAQTLRGFGSARLGKADKGLSDATCAKSPGARGHRLPG